MRFTKKRAFLFFVLEMGRQVSDGAWCGGEVVCLERVGYIVIFLSLHLCFKFWTPERQRSGKLLVTKHLQFILSFGFVYIHVDSIFFFLLPYFFPSWYIYFVLSDRNESPVLGRFSFVPKGIE